jgi:preprotein translocase subunit SecA
MNQQRTVIYKQRQDVLDDKDLSERLLGMIEGMLQDIVATHTAEEDAAMWDFDGLRSVLGYLCTDEDFRYTPEELKKLSRDDVETLLIDRATAKIKEKEELFTPETFHEVERAILLQNVDRAWMEHIDAMDDLKGSIGLQSYAQRDPIVEYRMVGADMFDSMVAEIRDKTVRMLLTVVPKPQEQIVRVQVAKPLIEGFEGGAGTRTKKKVSVSTTRREGVKVGRNDPCPCGSGKKYKACCGANQNKVD